MAEGYKDFTTGAVLTAADLEEYCELQGTLRFASAAARDSALAGVLTEGLLAFLKDTNTLTVYSGAAWSTIGPLFGQPTAWTPTWTGLTIGSASVACRYSRFGRFVFCVLDVTWAANTSISGDVSFTLPVAGSTSTDGLYYGGCSLVDATGDTYSGEIISKDLDEAYIRREATTSQALSSTSPFTWTTNDRFRSMFNYIAGDDA